MRRCHAECVDVHQTIEARGATCDEVTARTSFNITWLSGLFTIREGACK